MVLSPQLTKIHETFYRDDLDKFSGFKGKLKGELTVVISGKSENYDDKTVINTKKLNSEIKEYLKKLKNCSKMSKNHHVLEFLKLLSILIKF